MAEAESQSRTALKGVIGTLLVAGIGAAVMLRGQELPPKCTPGEAKPCTERCNVGEVGGILCGSDGRWGQCKCRLAQPPAASAQQVTQVTPFLFSPLVAPTPAALVSAKAPQAAMPGKTPAKCGPAPRFVRGGARYRVIVAPSLALARTRRGELLSLLQQNDNSGWYIWVTKPERSRNRVKEEVFTVSIAGTEPDAAEALCSWLNGCGWSVGGGYDCAPR